MEGRITEEQLTKAILEWLITNNWEIICFDFPQSGTGISLHPNEEFRTTKNKGSVIPDIVAIKNGIVIFFENKDRFVLGDFVKVDELRKENRYSESIEKLLNSFEYSSIYFGVGISHCNHSVKKTNSYVEKIDFAVFVYADFSIFIHYDPNELFV